MSAGSFISVPLLTVRRLAHSQKARVLLTAILLFDAAVIFGVVRMFAPRLRDWQTAGSLDRNLWLFCLASWAGSAGLSILAALQEGFGQKAILTFTLPVPNADRVRILYGSIVYQLLNLWLIAGCGFGIAATLVLGWQSFPWIVLVLAGHALAVLLSLFALFLSIRYLLRRPWTLWIVGGALSLIVFVVIRTASALRAVSPPLATGVFIVVLALALGPLAGVLGGFYARAFYVIQASSPRAVKRRYMSLLTGWLLQWRSPGAALFVKDLLTRSRHWANWGRIIVAVVAVAGFPLFRTQLRSRGLDDALIVVAFVLGGVLLTIVDGVSSPFGSEGNRLTLLLTAPISLGKVILSKFTSFVVPFSITAVATGAGIALAIGLGEGALRVSAAIVLMLFGISTVFILGSVFDVDLDVEVEGGLQGLMQEEAPLTPVRLALTVLGTLLFAIELLLLSRLPWIFACALFLLLDVILAAAGFQSAMTWFRKRILKTK
jgi:hypothetical protein